MNKEVDNLSKRSINIILNSERFCFITRGEELQRDCIRELTLLKEEVAEIKQKTIKTKDEDSANTLLSLECLIQAFISELNMWVSLKNDDPNSAWDFFVYAQQHARASFRASTALSLNFEGYLKKLLFIEKLVFPPLKFMSPEIIVENSKCSICGKNYDECDHIVGKAYLGEFCYKIVDKIKEIKGVAIVNEPANKLARVITFTEKGITRDILSWKIIDEKEDINQKK